MGQRGLHIVIIAVPGIVDAPLDLVSYTPEDFDAYAALKPGGRGASPNSAAATRRGAPTVWRRRTRRTWQLLGQLLDDGALRVPIQSTYGLDRAGEALRAFGATHTQGELGLQMTQRWHPKYRRPIHAVG
jgi:hypothetical protein